MPKFNLEKHLDNWTLNPETLAGMFDTKPLGSGEYIHVYSIPKVVCFGGKLFKGMFSFNNTQLRRIVLTPIIDNIENPGYPNKQYEDAKFEYCLAVLKELFGNKANTTEDSVCYTKDQYDINCSKIVMGRDQYEGGNIIITMKQKNTKKYTE